MQRSLSITVLMLVTAMASSQVVSDAEKKEGFTPLFNGKDFENWDTNEKVLKSWSIEDGVFRSADKPGGVYLFTKGEYEDFVLRLQWRGVKQQYDSGCLVRGTNTVYHQIEMRKGAEGEFYANPKIGKAVPKLHKPAGQWNEWEITCIGPKVSLKVNGTPAWEVDNFKALKGKIGLQYHGSVMEFKNIRIKILEPKKE